MFKGPWDSLVASNRGYWVCIYVWVSKWVSMVASIWKNRGSKSPLYTQIYLSVRTKYHFMYWGTSLFDKKDFSIWRKSFQKDRDPIPPRIHRRTPGCAQVEFPCLHPSTQKRLLLVPAPNNEDRASWFHLGQGGLLPRITWHQGIQTLCLRALTFQ